MHLFIEIRHNILKQCHRNDIEVKNFNDMLEIGIFRNYCMNILDVLNDYF